jgi:hypothetical protein
MHCGRVENVKLVHLLNMREHKRSKSITGSANRLLEKICKNMKEGQNCTRISQILTEQAGPVFGRCTAQISAGTPAFLTEVSRGFPQSLQANIGMETRSGQDRSLSNIFQFILFLTLCRPDSDNAVK